MSIDIPSLLSLRKKMEKYGPGSFAGCPELQGSQLLWTHEARCVGHFRPQFLRGPNGPNGPNRI